MSWAKLDHGFLADPRVLGLDDSTKILYLAGLVYCGVNQTDAFIPRTVLRMLLGLSNRATEVDADRLVAAGLWLVNPAGWTMVEFEPQQTAAQIQAVREKRAAAGRLGGQVSGLTRRQLADQRAIEANEAKSKQSATDLLRLVEANEAKSKQTRSKIEADRDGDRDGDGDGDTDTEKTRARVAGPPPSYTNGAAVPTRARATVHEIPPDDPENVAWWTAELGKRAAHDKVPLDELAAAVNVDDETARWREYTGDPYPPWRNWMRKAIDHAVRDYRKGVRYGAGTGIPAGGGRAAAAGAHRAADPGADEAARRAAAAAFGERLSRTLSGRGGGPRAGAGTGGLPPVLGERDHPQ